MIYQNSVFCLNSLIQHASICIILLTLHRSGVCEAAFEVSLPIVFCQAFLTFFNVVLVFEICFPSILFLGPGTIGCWVIQIGLSFFYSNIWIYIHKYISILVIIISRHIIYHLNIYLTYSARRWRHFGTDPLICADTVILVSVLAAFRWTTRCLFTLPTSAREQSLSPTLFSTAYQNVFGVWNAVEIFATGLCKLQDKI